MYLFILTSKFTVFVVFFSTNIFFQVITPFSSEPLSVIVSGSKVVPSGISSVIFSTFTSLSESFITFTWYLIISPGFAALLSSNISSFSIFVTILASFNVLIIFFSF